MGMFDDLPVVNKPQQESVPQQEEDVLTSTMRGIGQGATFGQAPNIGGAVNYALHGGAEGSFDEGYNRSANASQYSQEQHPDAYSVGNVVGGAATMAVPGGVVTRIAAKTPALVNQAIRYGLNAMGWGKGVKAIDVAMDIAPHLSKVMRAEQSTAGPTGPVNLPPKLADALRRAKAATEDPFTGPAPNLAKTMRRGPAPNERVSPLSREMQAKADAYQEALRRHALRSIEFPNR